MTDAIFNKAEFKKNPRYNREGFKIAGFNFRVIKAYNVKRFPNFALPIDNSGISCIRPVIKCGKDMQNTNNIFITYINIECNEVTFSVPKGLFIQIAVIEYGEINNGEC